MSNPISADIILQNLLAKGQITATGNRNFSLSSPLLPPIIPTGSAVINTITGSIAPPPQAEVLPSYDELVAAELYDAEVVLEPDQIFTDDTDPTIGMTASDAVALGLSEEEFASLSQSTDEKTATTSSVVNQGDKGKGLPKVPILDLSNVLGTVGRGASPITLAAQAALTSVITTYVTNYVASQIAPLQMQVTAVAAAVPAGMGSIASIPGKIKSIIAKIQSVVAKVKSAVARAKAASRMIPTVQKQVRDKVTEARAKVAERGRLVSTKAQAAASRASESAGDTLAKSRKTATDRLNRSKSGLANTNARVTWAGAQARARTNQAISNSDIVQSTIITTDPITGMDSSETITEAIGPSVETQTRQTIADGTVQAQSAVMGLSSVSTSIPTPNQGVARQRALDMYARNPDSLSLAITLYITEGGGTREQFMTEAGA